MTNPYAPPAAPVADVESPLIGLRRRSVVMAIVLTIVTFGLYYPIWFIRRWRALNQLDSPRKLQVWPSVFHLITLIINLLVGIVSGEAPPAAVIGAEADLTIRFATLAGGLLVLWQCFITKDILQDHLAGDGDASMFSARPQLSGLATFFFQILYLQHVINRDILARPRPAL